MQLLVQLVSEKFANNIFCNGGHEAERLTYMGLAFSENDANVKYTFNFFKWLKGA